MYMCAFWSKASHVGRSVRPRCRHYGSEALFTASDRCTRLGIMNILTTRADRLAFPALLIVLMLYLVLATDRFMSLVSVGGFAPISCAALIVLLVGLLSMLARKEFGRARTGVLGTKATTAMTFVLGFGLLIRLGTGSIAVLALPATLVCTLMQTDPFFGEPCLSGGALLIGMLTALGLAGATDRLLRERYVWNPRHLRVVVPIVYVLALASAPSVLFL